MSGRWAVAEIDASAIEHNVGVLRRLAAPADVWAVVKADGYGHGAYTAATAAVRAGAAGLCVALVDEGRLLRERGLTVPVLVFGEQPAEQVEALLAADLTPTVYTPAYVARLAAASEGRVAVHVNVDTGMQRIGAAADTVDALIAALIEHRDTIEVAAIYTHLACADDPSNPANAQQLDAYDRLLARFAAAGIEPATQHAANSAGAMAHPSARRSFVRAGIAVYGISPGPGVDHLCDDLRPAMRLTARVSYVKQVAAGTHISYGWRHRFDRATTIATVPIGYADGVPRRLGTVPDGPGGDVLIGGRRRPIVGVVTMDQLMVDVGDQLVTPGDEVVLIGDQGDERVRAEEWATRLGTIGYEIVCGVSARVPRSVIGDASASTPTS